MKRETEQVLNPYVPDKRLRCHAVGKGEGGNSSLRALRDHRVGWSWR